MKKILVIGAGLSSASLIKYLLLNAVKENWHITIADKSLELAKEKLGKSKRGNAIQFDINNKTQRQHEIKLADMVVSLLPPSLHILVAKDCLQFKKHLITASYVSPEMRELHKKVQKAGLIFLNEIGLDPGIDHLSAMEMIHNIQKKGGEIVFFKSFCGGLISPEFDNNPWNYKFTWNPRNVVLAGQATAQYIENGLIKFIPPNRIFEQTETVKVTHYGVFESYANRDSLSYIEPYGLKKAKTVLRGTLRKSGYSKSWNLLVKLGITDDSLELVINNLTYRDWIASFVKGANSKNVEQLLCKQLNISITGKEFKKLKWLGLFNNELIPLKKASSAQILQHLLQQKWRLEENDLDMIVMKHEIEYLFENKLHKKNATLVVKGDDKTHTAMAKTVGLPMAIACKLILKGVIKAKGVHIPILPEMYQPILKELAKHEINFNEE